MSTIEATRRYTFRGEVLTRTYEPLIRAAKTDDQRDQLIVEYRALNRCYQVYVQWDRRVLALW